MGTAGSLAWLEAEGWESKGHLVVKALMKEGNIKYVHFLILLKRFQKFCNHYSSNKES